MASISRESLGDVVAGCELREVAILGAGRHHHYAAVLRDLVGNIWECQDDHPNQDEAHECAKGELARRIGSGEVKPRRGAGHNHRR